MIYTAKIMVNPKIKIRLFSTAPLIQGENLVLPENQSHYVTNVMRQKAGDAVVLINDTNGEWECHIIEPHKKKTIVRVVRQLSQAVKTPECHLYITPLKKDALSYAVEKATECGATHIHFIKTDFTDVPRVNIDRLQATAMEASEQCRRYDVPQIFDIEPLEVILNRPHNFMVAAEDGRGEGQKQERTGVPHLMIGPEGGFSPREFELLQAAKNVNFIDLGPRILRAETAVVVGLSKILPL